MTDHEDIAVAALRPWVESEAIALTSGLVLARKLHHDRVRRLSFMSADAMATEDKLIRQERADRVRHAQERVVPPGYTAAPGSIAVHAVLADVFGALARLDARAQQREARWPACLWPKRAQQPSEDDLLTQVVAHAALTQNTGWLQEAGDQLASLNREVTRLVNGPDEARVPDLCPFCRNESLVMHDEQGGPTWVECSTERRSGRALDCTCWDPYCPCKTRPAYRHRWEGNEQLHALAGLIRHAKEATAS